MSKKSQQKIRRVAILTGGGDCPGLNAVIRSVTRTAIVDFGWDVFGIEDGFVGLVEGQLVTLTTDSVSGILTQGGTILGTSNRANPFRYEHKVGESVRYEDASKRAFKLLKDKAFDVLFCIGGEGTMSFAKRFVQEGMPIIGIPKTIDNDIPGTERSVGFYSAVSTATDAIDKLHTTAASHHRVMIIEVMGRTAGWLALASSLAGGADIILLPEIPFDLKKIYERVKFRSSHGRKFTIVVVGEGARAQGGERVVQRKARDVTNPERLGGISHWLAENIEKETGIEARAVVLGHLLRSGPPVFQDRILATSLGYEAVHRAAAGETDMMMAWVSGKYLSVPIATMPAGPRLVSNEHLWIQTCRAMGAIFAE